MRQHIAQLAGEQRSEGRTAHVHCHKTNRHRCTAQVRSHYILYRRVHQPVVRRERKFVPRRAVWTYLKRLWRFGLLERTSLSGALKYKISERGMARLRWLR